MDARLSAERSAERPDAVASKRTSSACSPAGVMGWTAATQLANIFGSKLIRLVSTHHSAY